MNVYFQDFLLAVDMMEGIFQITKNMLIGGRQHNWIINLDGIVQRPTLVIIL